MGDGIVSGVQVEGDTDMDEGRVVCDGGGSSWGTVWGESRWLGMSSGVEGWTMMVGGRRCGEDRGSESGSIRMGPFTEGSCCCCPAYCDCTPRGNGKDSLGGIWTSVMDGPPFCDTSLSSVA